MTSDLAVKTTRSMLWSIAENTGLQITQFTISIILARLLSPEQFGLIGMLSLFMALAQSLLDSGFGSALVHKQDADQVDACSIFYFNLAAGVCLMLLLIAAAPLIAAFFAQPELTPLTMVLSVTIVINAFGLVPLALLNKGMEFRALLNVNLAAVAVSGVVGVAAALTGFGVWSLVIQAVLAALVRSVAAWWVSGWRLSLVFSRASLKSMFPFGSRLMLSGLLDTLFQNIYLPIIGKVDSAQELGYYTRAQSMQAMAVQSTSTALARVMFPALVPIQRDSVRLKQVVQKSVRISVFFHFPLMIGLIAVASPLITLLMTDKWAPSVPYFQLLCVVGLLLPLHVLNLNVLKVRGRSDLFFRLEVIKKVLLVTSIALTYKFGVTGLLYGQIAVSIIAYYLNCLYTGQMIDYPIGPQMRDFLPLLLISLVMGVSMYLAGSVASSNLVQLMIEGTVGVAIYLLLAYFVAGDVVADVWRLMRQAVKPTGRAAEGV